MTKDQLRAFLFRGLLFESEAGIFQRAGIQIGASETAVEESLLAQSLAPFGVQRRNAALEMSRLYALIYCFENEIRDFIRERLEENEGENWISNIPGKILQHAESRRTIALKDSWLEGQKTDILGFADFGQLGQIIVAKWDCFKDVIPSQHWLSQRMDEIEKARHFIAHNRQLLPSEFARLYMYISDWNRVIGL
ncbi:Swt1 family HEPN domain-containing protein [Sphingomonas sp. HITSZ_GF]|uniref:Swt1 family HEPN domain-containing protein n=1 Tax=Sphingomonas sp. HITSZ_GF TaxID=3037247 RepID=UPI00240DC6F8|nr:Swt1 family HEPN domain-containing protein [Sphingomonas sp. HITSZ_GF]MDG2533543.1 Swt1 family HEPN domain-containing protein [Sphingomonas sp. HITSZ_GF]